MIVDDFPFSGEKRSIDRERTKKSQKRYNLLVMLISVSSIVISSKLLVMLISASSICVISKVKNGKVLKSNPSQIDIEIDNLIFMKHREKNRTAEVRPINHAFS